MSGEVHVSSFVLPTCSRVWGARASRVLVSATRRNELLVLDSYLPAMNSRLYHKPLMMHEWRGSGLKAWERRELRVVKPVLSGVEGVSPGSPIACHAEAVCEGRSILPCSLRFRGGCLSFARPFSRLWSSSVTNSTGFLLLFGSGPIALAPFLAFLTQLLLVQIRLELFIGKTTAETSGGNCQCRCNFYWSATRYHMPWAFRQRIGIWKRKLTTT